MSTRRQLLMNAGLLAGTVVAGTAGKASAAPAARPAPEMPFTVPEGAWTEFGELRRAGGVLHYAAIGPQDSGQPPVVLLHKLGGWLADWRQVAPALAQGRRVIAFDLPGHGGSRWDGAPPYIQSLGETAALLIGAFDELGLAQVDLIGTSLGGCIGVPLAAFWPERIRKLAIVSSALAGRKTLAEIKSGIDDKQAGTAFDARGLPMPSSPETLRKVFGIINADRINAEGWESRKAAARWIQPSERGVVTTDVREMLKRVPVETLLLYGDRDPTYPRFRPDAQAALPRSITKTVSNSGAFVMMDNPAETAKVLRAWIGS